jgi:molecular chaperone IbpA
MSIFELNPLYQQSPSFRRLSELLDQSSSPRSASLTYDIENTGDNRFRLSLLVPGYKTNELEVEAVGNQVTIRGNAQQDDQGRQFVYRSIFKSDFEQRFQLGDHVIVTGSELRDGVLHVNFERQTPESEKARLIPIKG